MGRLRADQVAPRLSLESEGDTRHGGWSVALRGGASPRPYGSAICYPCGVMEQNLVSAGYDAVYEATPKSPTLRRLWREHASGADFPDEFANISFVTIPQLKLIDRK